MQPFLALFRYVPTQDLYNIYKEYYGKEKIDEKNISTCSTLLVLER